MVSYLLHIDLHWQMNRPRHAFVLIAEGTNVVLGVFGSRAIDNDPCLLAFPVIDRPPLRFQVSVS